MDKQYRVRFEEKTATGRPGSSLNMRLSGAGSVAPVAASIKPRVIVHVTGPANAAGYAPGYVAGWLGKDGRTIYSDSFSVDEASVDAVLLMPEAWEPQGAQDVYGRQPGLVRGWVYLAYLEEITSNIPEDAP